MEQTSKYFPKTAAAISMLKESATLLCQNAELSVDEKKELKTKLANLRQQLTDKAACIDDIINKLNGAIK